MSKKIVAIYGSQRSESNSAFLADCLLGAVPGEDVEIKKYYLGSMDVHHCRGCFACRRNGNVCIHKDDIPGLLEAIGEADRVIVSIPVFFSQAASIVTAFIHRGYNLLSGENGQYSLRIEPKDTVVIYSQGSPFSEEFRTGIELTNSALCAMGLRVTKTIICTLANRPGAVKERAELLEKAAEAGKKLFL